MNLFMFSPSQLPVQLKAYYSMMPTLTAENQHYTYGAHSVPRGNQVSSYISPSQDGTALGLLNIGTAGRSFAQTCRQDRLRRYVQKHITVGVFGGIWYFHVPVVQTVFTCHMYQYWLAV